MEENTIDNWREEVNNDKYETLKILDGQTIAFNFEDEGTTTTPVDFDPAIKFTVLPLHDNPGMQKYTWYVNKKNYALLNEIKALGTLKDKSVEVSRTGSKKSDTRYTIKEVVGAATPA